MRAVSALPEGYRELLTVDLKEDRRCALAVNLIAVALAVITMIPPMFLLRPLQFTLPQLGVLAVGTVLYIILHELVHGLAMKLLGTQKVRYGLAGVYAFACSDDYYGKGAYLFMALAPVVLWGAVLAVAALLVPAPWFWVVHLIQVVNLSGAAGDFYVTVKFAGLPPEILVQDYGVGMRVYSK